METAVLLIMLALIQYMVFAMFVAKGRDKYGVHAPSCSGDPAWERLYRIQMNTMEQIIIFIPSVLAFSYFVSSKWVLLPGLTYLVGRIIYFRLYVQNKNRVVGFSMTFVSNIIMVAGSIIGAALSLLKS
jgi:glutathione S-transferase